MGKDVNQTKSEVVKEHQDQILLDKISGRNKETNENTSRGEENHQGYGIRPLPRRVTPLNRKERQIRLIQMNHAILMKSA